MQQSPRLFFNIDLLSNNKTFKMGSYNPLGNLWLFNHFNHLHINKHIIHYKLDTADGLEKPVSKLRKKFQKTGELIEYLTSKNYFYQHFELEFTNFWKIKSEYGFDLIFHTNSQEERDDLIYKLYQIEGIRVNKESISQLNCNHTYVTDLYGNFKIDPYGWMPDDYWDEATMEKWRRWYSDIILNKH